MRLPARTAVLALAASAAACGRGCAPGETTVVYDLVARVPVAQRASGPETILFGTPEGEAHQAEGFFRWAGGAGDRFVWARREVEVALRFDAPAARAAVLDVQPFTGVRDQAVAVLLNGAAVARFALNDLRQRYPIPLPAEAQRAGENRLRFEFASTASARDVDAASSDGGQLAAAFYGLVVGPAGDPALDDLLLRDAPRPFAIGEREGVPAVTLMGPASVRFALRLPEAAELRFTPRLEAAALSRQGRARVRVSLRTSTGAETELWAGRLGAGQGQPAEVRLTLPRSDAAVELGLHVERDGPGRFAWVALEAPRVMGRNGPSLERRAFDERQNRRADALRQSLAGRSVVLLVLDAARAESLSAYGYPRRTTPEIDRLAKEGVRFEAAFTPAVFTVAAISSLWTSQQPDQHHADTGFGERLPPGRLTLAELLSAQGIRTAGFVANAMAGRALGFERGFSEFHEIFGDPELGSRAEVFRKHLPRWLEAHRDERFFLYAHFREPHFPYDPPPPFDTAFGPNAPLDAAARSDRGWYQAVNRGEHKPTRAELEHLARLYDGNLAYVDREIGELRRTLERLGLLERVALVVTADHGEQLGEQGYVSHSAQLYEQSLRIPLVMRLPGGPAGRVVPGLVDLVDLAPTLADILGVAGRGGSDSAFEGRSLLPAIVGAPLSGAIVSRTVWDAPRYARRDERHKYVLDTHTGAEELYDLRADPKEATNLVTSQPLEARFQRQELELTLGLLRSRARGGPADAFVSPEQCENMRSLGYVGNCPTPPAPR